MKKVGYGLLGLLPHQLFSLTLPELQDMVEAKQYYEALNADQDMQKTAWQTSLLMSATGNYGKKGIEPKKLYKPVFDEQGNYIDPTENSGQFKPIDKELKETKMNELIAKFNKD